MVVTGSLRHGDNRRNVTNNKKDSLVDEVTTWLKAHGRPRQKVMIIAGLVHVMCHPAKSNHPRDSSMPWDGRTRSK